MKNKENQLIWEKYILSTENTAEYIPFNSELKNKEPVPLDNLPEFISIENILNTGTEYMGDSEETIKSYYKEPVITRVVKDYGYGDNFRRSTPDDFYYLVVIKYKCEGEYCLDPYMYILVGVSKDGSNRQVFQG